MKPAHATGRSYLLAFVAIVGGAAFGIGADRTLLIQQQGIKRTILLRADDPGSPKYEAIMGIAELAPGASSGRHRHFGVEVGYVLEGSMAIEQEGRPTVTLKAGDAFKNDAVHDARNPGTAPTKILAVYIVEKDKPLAEPVR
jgi:quercetin dioxygenase-like cupin family protein